MFGRGEDAWVLYREPELCTWWLLNGGCLMVVAWSSVDDVTVDGYKVAELDSDGWPNRDRAQQRGGLLLREERGRVHCKSEEVRTVNSGLRVVPQHCS